jgi:hypothetical protein
MLKISQDLWVNEHNIMFLRKNTSGFTEITCNPLANVNRYNFPNDNWIVIDDNLIADYKIK